MAVDISTQLEAIRNEEQGEAVLSAIGSAFNSLLQDGRSSTNIQQELSIIANGTYGSEIRSSIADALYKLSIASGSGSEGGKFITSFIVPMLAVNSCIIGDMTEET